MQHEQYEHVLQATYENALRCMRCEMLPMEIRMSATDLAIKLHGLLQEEVYL